VKAYEEVSFVNTDAVSISIEMSPLTALSVAASISQFVDFGSKFLSSSRKLYQSADGTLRENLDTEIVMADLRVCYCLCEENCQRTVRLYLKVPLAHPGTSSMMPPWTVSIDDRWKLPLSCSDGSIS
jgi:hypothetical protein